MPARETKLSEHVSVIKRGESVMWLRVMGAPVHVVIGGKSDGHKHREILSYLIERLRA